MHAFTLWTAPLPHALTAQAWLAVRRHLYDNPSVFWSCWSGWDWVLPGDYTITRHD